VCVSVEEKQLKVVANKMTGLVPTSARSWAFKSVTLLHSKRLNSPPLTYRFSLLCKGQLSCLQWFFSWHGSPPPLDGVRAMFVAGEEGKLSG